MVYRNGEAIAASTNSNGGTSQEVYSMEERAIGSWIDGRPLYQRTYYITSPTYENTDTNILLLDENVSIKRIDGMLTTIESDGSISPINFAHNAGAMCACWFKPRLHCIYMRVGTGVQTSRPVELTLKYTKSTDEPTNQLEDSQYLQSIAGMAADYAMPVTTGGIYTEEGLADV